MELCIRLAYVIKQLGLFVILESKSYIRKLDFIGGFVNRLLRVDHLNPWL